MVKIIHYILYKEKKKADEGTELKFVVSKNHYLPSS